MDEPIEFTYRGRRIMAQRSRISMVMEIGGERESVIVVDGESIHVDGSYEEVCPRVRNPMGEEDQPVSGWRDVRRELPEMTENYCDIAVQSPLLLLKDGHGNICTGWVRQYDDRPQRLHFIQFGREMYDFDDVVEWRYL